MNEGNLRRRIEEVLASREERVLAVFPVGTHDEIKKIAEGDLTELLGLGIDTGFEVYRRNQGGSTTFVASTTFEGVRFRASFCWSRPVGAMFDSWMRCSSWEAWKTRWSWKRLSRQGEWVPINDLTDLRGIV